MSFKKRPKPVAGSSPSDRIPLPNGVRISSENATPITSWGLTALDSAIGGGLPLGTLTILAEDYPSAYYQPIISYVIAQGIHNEHAVAIASFHISPQYLLEQIPARTDRQTDAVNAMAATRRGTEDMKIAWRYQKNAHPSTHTVSGESVRSFAQDFDLSLKPSIPTNAPISCLDRKTFSMSLSVLLEQLEMHLVKASSEKRLARIIVQGLSEAFVKSPQDITLTEFLCRLRGLCRVYGCVAVATCARDVPLRLQSVASDALLQLDSFEGRGAGVAGLGKEWLGVVVIKKSYREGRGRSVRGKGDVWVFKRGRRKYTMERATAAPDEGVEEESVEKNPNSFREAEAKLERVGSGVCSSRPSSSFEF